jgi:hypothetical protein
VRGFGEEEELAVWEKIGGSRRDPPIVSAARSLALCGLAPAGPTSLCIVYHTQIAAGD